MATERRVFGKLPVNRGSYVSGATYYKYNIVQNNGSSFMATQEGTLAAPEATYDPNTGTFDVTTGWVLMAYGATSVELENKIGAKASIVDLMSASAYADRQTAGATGPIKVAAAEEADDLSGTSNDRLRQSARYLIRTVAEGESIKDSEPAHLISIAGGLDDDCNPFNLTGIRWTGFNQIITSQKIANAYVLNGAITTNSSYSLYYIRCPKCEWGSYGNASKNNGYLFTDNNGNPITPYQVYHCASTPINGAQVTSVATHVYGSLTYYLPNEGWLCVVLPNSTNISNVCAHIAWSNGKDASFVAPGGSTTIDLSSILNSVHSGWASLAGIDDGGRSVRDEIVFDATVSTNRKWYRRIDRVQLKNLTWTMTTETSGEGAETKYIFTAPVSGILNNGLFKTKFAGLTLTDTTLRYESTTITTVNALVTAMGNDYLYFELATVGSGTHSLTGIVENYSDYGTEEILGATVDVGLIETDYVQGLKDYLRRLPSLMTENNLTVSEAIAALYLDVENVKDLLRKESFNKIKAEDLDLINRPTFIGCKTHIIEDFAPNVAPDFIGQKWTDTTTGYIYEAAATTNSSSWKRVDNA